MEPHGRSREAVREALREARDRDLDYAGGRILGSMGTAPHPLAREAHAQFIEANLGDSGLYPGTAVLERDAVAWLAELVGLPPHGRFTSGGSEANLLAIWVARERGGHEVILSQNAHFSLFRAVHLLGLEPVVVGLRGDGSMDTGTALAALGPDTAALVAVAGSTELGAVDDLPALADGKGDTWLHIDGALGGLVLPFSEPGWRLPAGVDSFTVDPHKMGMATRPAGVLLTREAGALDATAIDSPYLTRRRQVGLLGTRASAAVAGAWAVMAHLGRAGYRERVVDCLTVMRRLQRGCCDLGLEPVTTPRMNILGLRHDDPEALRARLAKRGWHVSVGTRPPALRLVVMPHVTPAAAEEFLQVLAEELTEPQ